MVERAWSVKTTSTIQHGLIMFWFLSLKNQSLIKVIFIFFFLKIDLECFVYAPVGGFISVRNRHNVQHCNFNRISRSHHRGPRNARHEHRDGGERTLDQQNKSIVCLLIQMHIYSEGNLVVVMKGAALHAFHTIKCPWNQIAHYAQRQQYSAGQ